MIGFRQCDETVASLIENISKMDVVEKEGRAHRREGMGGLIGGGSGRGLSSEKRMGDDRDAGWGRKGERVNSGSDMI